MSRLEMSISSAAAPKPTSGEIKQDLEDLDGLLPIHAGGADVGIASSWLAMPTPMMEPTMVWELEAGRPNHQVPRFQRMAAMSRAKTMAKPAPELT